jgi:hypothetical protein
MRYVVEFDLATFEGRETFRRRYVVASLASKLYVRLGQAMPVKVQTGAMCAVRLLDCGRTMAEMDLSKPQT